MITGIFQIFPNFQKNLSAIYCVTFLGGVASTMVLSLLPVFIHEELGLSYTQVGMVEAIAISATFLAKFLSGFLSDYLKKRKSLIMIGFCLNLVLKPVFALATGLYGILIAKSLDRLAKGIRATPMEALIADISPPLQRGMNYGIRYTCYAGGFMVGGALSSYLIAVTHGDFRFIFWLSLIPSIVCLGILGFFVTDVPLHTPVKKIKKFRDTLIHLRAFPPAFWQLMGIIFCLMLGRFHESFLYFRGRELGFSIASLPVLMVLYNFMEALMPIPIGLLIDKRNKHVIFMMGVGVLALAHGVLLLPMISNAAASSLSISMALSMAFAGLHMGMTQGLMGTFIANLTPPHLRGTGFAIYYLVVGVSASLSNIMAGFLSSASQLAGYGTLGAFAFGFFTTCLTLVLMMIYRPFHHDTPC